MTIVVLALFVAQQATLTPAETKKHVGEMATVCGKVVSTRYASSSRGQPTFLNLEKAYPNQVFTVVIFGEHRPRFGEPEKEFANQTICATGKIEEYRGVPQIVAKEPKQITKSDAAREVEEPALCLKSSASTNLIATILGNASPTSAASIQTVVAGG